MRSSVERNGRDTPTAKSLVLDLLSTMPPRCPVPVGALVAAAALFEIGENNLRVGLARLRAAGLVESDERGSYRLGVQAEAVDQRVRSWRTIEDDLRPWDGGWVGVASGRAAGPDRSVAQRRARALDMLGFRPLGRHLCIRPDNLAGSVPALRRELDRLGLGPGALVFRLSSLDDVTERRARTLWNAKALEAGYDADTARLTASTARLASLARDEAMIESFLLGGAAVRRIVLDPLLPDPIVNTRKRSALIETMRQYDRLGRRYWKGWSGTAVALARSPGGALATNVGGMT